jgi:crotonobetainyl-CoA:carnitine CoA-transferase CaiB-like acyl-CoA transferase
LVNQASAYLNAGVVPGRLGNRHPSIAPYETLRTADAPIAMAVGNDGQFARLCGVLSATRLAADARFKDNPSRVRHRGALIEELETVLRTRPAAEWVDALSAAGVPCGPVNSIDQTFALAERLGLGPVVRPPGWPASVASPLRLSGTPVSYRLPPPGLNPPVTPP